MKFKKTVCIAAAALIMASVTSCTGNSSNISSTTKVPANTVTTAPTTTAAPTIPVREPDKIGNMQMGTLYYKPAQAASVYTVQTQGMTSGKIAMLRCLQGLVARTGAAEIYLLNDSNDTFWKDHTTNEYGTIFNKSTSIQLIEKYIGKIKSVVLYDLSKPYQFAVAQTLAATQDGIAVDSVTYQSVKNYFEKNIKNKKITFTDISAQITSAEQAITYTAEKLYDKALHHYIGIVNISSPINDYIYATKSIAVSVDSSDVKQVAALKKLLNKDYTKPAVAFTDKAGFENTVSQFGFCVVRASGFSNSTFLSSFPTSKKSLALPGGSDKLAKNGKVYISIGIKSDSNTAVTSSLSNITNSVVRGNTPITIDVNPSLFELAPPVLNWFYGKRNASSTLVSLSMGYSDIHASSFNKAAMQSWYLTNKKFLSSTGLTVISSPSALSDEIIGAFAENLEITGYLCSAAKNSYMVGDTAVVRTIDIDNIAEFDNYKFALSEASAQFVYINISASGLSSKPYNDLENLVSKFQLENDGNVEFLLANDMVTTMKQYYAAKAKAIDDLEDETQTVTGNE